MVVWNISTRKMEFFDGRMGHEVKSVAAARVAAYFAAAYEDGEVRVWSYHSNKELCRWNLMDYWDGETDYEIESAMERSKTDSLAAINGSGKRYQPKAAVTGGTTRR